MPPISLSREQHEAIHEPGHLLVRAGAGSGKTEVLARRFVAHIAGDIDGCEPLTPANIAAITFTDKATDDMRRRVREVLDEAGATADADTAGDPERRTRLLRARRTFGLARISTIHGFCSRILRENPLEAHIDPDFEVLDALESATWIERNCQELLIAAVKRGDSAARRLVTTRNLRGASIYRAGALELVMELTNALAATGHDDKWLREQTRVSAELAADDARQVRPLAIELAKRIETLLKAKDRKIQQRVEELRANWPRFRSLVESIDSDSPPEVLEELRKLTDYFPEARIEAIKELVAAVREILNGGGPFGVRGKLVTAYGTARAAAAMVEVADLIADIAEEIDRRARADRVLTFDGLLKMTRELLRRDDIAERYRSSLGAILVDEYQDTDPIQDDIVTMLTAPRAGFPSPRLFIVGDEKQSIYRFRGADVTVINRPRDPAPTERPLRENRRSTPGIINFINALSAHVMRTDQPSAHWVTWNSKHALKQVRPPVEGPAVEILFALAKSVDKDSDPTDSADSPELPESDNARIRETRAIADWIASAIQSGLTVIDRTSEAPRPLRHGDIAILLRSFTDVDLYERALDAIGIEFYTVKGRGFFGCAEVIDIESILAAINDPEDGVSLAAALRSPIVGLSDNCLLELAYLGRESRIPIARLFTLSEPPDFGRLGPEGSAAAAARVLIASLREARLHMTITGLIEWMLERTGFEAVMLGQPGGRQRVANIRKLVEIARRFDESGLFTLGDFVNHLRRLAEYEPREPQAQILGEDDNVVRLMTIHQSKGLEFPVVILADIGRGQPTDNRRHVISSRHGLVMCDTAGSGQDDIPNRMLDEFREDEKDRELAELARILYVATTRARDRLILSEGAPGRGHNWASQIRKFIGYHYVEDFLASTDAERLVSTDGGPILMRRAMAHVSANDSSIDEEVDRSESAEIVRLAGERLGYAAAAPTEIVASPTQLADFDRCPRQYMFRYELGMPETAIFGSTAGGALEMGLVAHAVLEAIDEPPPADDLVKTVRATVDRHAAGTGLSSAERAEIAADLACYLAAYPPRGAAADKSVVEREVPFFINLRDDGVSLYIRGRIDLIVRAERGLIVRDYKYARHVSSDKRAYQIQMESYAIAAASRYPDETVAAELLFLRDGPAAMEVALPPRSDSIRHLAALARELIDARQRRDFPRRPESPDTCRKLRCGYIRRCWKGNEPV